MGGSVELPGSFRPTPRGDVRTADKDARVSITLHLKYPEEPQLTLGSVEDFAQLLVRTSRDKLARKRRVQFRSVRPLLASFAERYGLTLGAVRPMRRTARIEGTVGQVGKALGATLHQIGNGKECVFERSGALQLPQEIAPWTRAILGFGGARSRAATPEDAAAGPGLWPREIAALYGIPSDAKANGQCIGVIAQGGAYLSSDLESAAQQSGTPVPVVMPPVNTASFGVNQDADTELALDLQVLAGVAPGAKLAIYSVPNKIENIVDALHAALSDSVNAPHVISLCWGSSEDEWPPDVRSTLDAALRDAINLGVAVVVAAGDYLATGAMLDGRAHVFYPASSPYVLSCGGTVPTLDGTGQRILDEEVWNNPIQAVGTGGGISANYPVPNYQSTLALPPSANPGAKPGRGAPDVAAAAWSDPGYAIMVGGQRFSEPGTSAATPLWAGILALANARRSSPLGFANHTLYANRGLLRQIVKGNNKTRGIGYDAMPEWNACTGLGVPQGIEIIEALAAATPEEKLKGADMV